VRKNPHAGFLSYNKNGAYGNAPASAFIRNIPKFFLDLFFILSLMQSTGYTAGLFMPTIKTEGLFPC